MANRLLLLAGSLRIAELTGRKLFLHWPVNAALGCAFPQLFTNPITLFRAEDVNAVLDSCTTLKVYNTWHLPPLYTGIAEDGDRDAQIVIVKGWHAPRFRSEQDTPAFWNQVRPHLHALKATPGIRDEVGRFMLPERCLGVHLRRADRPVTQFGMSTDEHFERIMDAAIAAEPAVTFFVATDDAATEQKFRARYGARALSFPKSRPGRNIVRGIEEALVDLLLLGRTRAVLGNHHSSFSFLAGELTGRTALYATEESAGTGLHATIDTLMGALNEPVAKALPA